MFKRIHSTQYPPKDLPVMAWDENCGFCHYWVIKWKKLTGNKVNYTPFQQVYQDFPDIELKYFRQAIRFIDVDGSAFAGPGAVFQALHRYGSKWKWVMPLYKRIGIFRFLADHFYSFVSRNRTRMYSITIRLFGRNPARPKYYWAYYLGTAIAVVGGVMFLV